MENINVKINRETRKIVDLPKSTIGNDGENLQENLVFSFEDEFVDGQGRLEIILPNKTRNFINLTKIGETYQMPVKSILTKTGRIYMQLVIDEGTNENSVPIFKSNIFYVIVNKSINAPEEEPPEGYSSWLEIANAKLNQIDSALEDVNTTIEEANNLDLDVSKDGKVATVTLTKKDSTTKTVTLSDGTSLMFNWDGTRLGIKTDNDADYTYVDLQGIQGPIGPKGEAFTIKKTYTSVAEMNADFNNMQLGDYVMIASTIEVEDNAKLYTRGEEQWIFISDFSGATGIRGETGLTPNIQIGSVVSGNTPNVTRTGTNENPILNFTLVKGETGATGDTGPVGPTGNGIVSVVKTSTDGLVDTYTITYTNGTTSTFNVTNGENGEVTQTQFDKLKHRVSDLESNQLTNTATGTEIHVEDAHETEVMEDKMSKVSSQETTTGKNIFHIESVTPVAEYITYTKVNENKIILNLTNTNVQYKYVTIPVEVEPNTNYYFKAKISSTNASMTNLWLGINPTNGGSSLINGRYVSETEKTFNSGDNNIVNILLYTNGNEKGANIATWENIQLTKTSGDSFEPYTGGQASPNPDYPQEIKTVKGYRNEFDEALLSQEANYNTYNENTKLWTTTSNQGYSQSILYSAVGASRDRDITKLVKLGIGSYLIKLYDFINNTGIASDSLQFGLYDSTGVLISNTRGNDTTIITTTQECYLDIRRYSSTGTFSFSKIAIFEGTEEKPYVPYGTNYVYKKIVGKNLFNKNDVTYKNFAYKNNDGNEVSSTASGYTTSYTSVNPNTTYTIKGSLKRNDDSSTFAIYFYDKNKNWISRNSGLSTIPYTFITPQNCCYIQFQYIVDTYTDDNVQLEQGTQATSYEPYQENIVTIPLNGNEIAGTDSAHKDILLVDSDGHCYLQKNTRGLELAIADMDNDENYPGWKNQEQFKDDYPNMNTSFSSKGIAFKSNITLDGLAVVSNTVFAPSKGIIMLNESIFNLTQTQWKEQYPDLVFKLLYALQTPDIIDLNYDVDIRLFKGVNNISNSDDMDMEIKYVQDISTIISNINNAILEIGGNE